MGMFDYVTCDHPLPDGMDAHGVAFQTKSYEHTLAWLHITAGGRLLVHQLTRAEGPATSEAPLPEPFAGIGRVRASREILFNGPLTFYGASQNAPDEMHRYVANFVAGALTNIEAAPAPAAFEHLVVCELPSGSQLCATYAGDPYLLLPDRRVAQPSPAVAVRDEDAVNAWQADPRNDCLRARGDPRWIAANNFLMRPEIEEASHPAGASLQEQIADARKTISEWPAWLKRSVQLEGRDFYLEQAQRSAASKSHDEKVEDNANDAGTQGPGVTHRSSTPPDHLIVCELPSGSHLCAGPSGVPYLLLSDQSTWEPPEAITRPDKEAVQAWQADSSNDGLRARGDPRWIAACAFSARRAIEESPAQTRGARPAPPGSR